MSSELQSETDAGLLQSVMDAVHDGVTVIDRELRVIYRNASIQRKFGDIVGRKCFEAYRGRAEPCVDCTILEVLEDGKHRQTLKDTRLSDGRVMWMECSCGPLLNAEGEVVGAIEIVRDVSEQMRLTQECATLRREVQRQADFANIITQSNVIKDLFRLVERIAPTNSPVLILGESGTGKELFARAVWQNSDRREKPFVPINCAAIPESLLESELFGHARGAFTGATSDRPGLVEAAHNGTLFLDEIGEMSLALQPKLLRFLQDGEFRRVGDQKIRKINVRVIAATNKNIEEAVRVGAFREDLYYRLSVIPMDLPPLRHRPEDIPMLASHFLQRHCDANQRAVTGISPTALKTLLDYPWPGNVRELENVIEYALHLTDDGHAIGVEQLPRQLVSRAAEPMANDFLRAGALVSIEEYTKLAISALEDDHTEEQIASVLGISRKTLWEKRRRWHLPRTV